MRAVADHEEPDVAVAQRQAGDVLRQLHDAGTHPLRLQQFGEIGKWRTAETETPAFLVCKTVTMESDSVSARARTPRKARTGCHRARTAPARDTAASGGFPENLRQSS